jgi:cysteine-rich repeat protein
MKLGSRSLLWGAVMCALACSRTQDSYVVVHADVDCDVPRVFQMKVVVANSTKSDQTLFPEKPALELGFPSDFALAIPSSRAGWVQIAVDALDENLNVIGQGSVSGLLKAGARIDLNLQLSVSPAICGNGILESGEQCDDGNRVSGDGCSSSCKLETVTPLESGIDGGVGASRDAQLAGPPFVQVSTGGGQSCAVRTDSTLWCWGDNTYGQLRLANITNRLTPIGIGDTAWNRVSCGQSHTCSLRTDGSLSCWGNNTSGQLGNPLLSTTSGKLQTEVTGGPWLAVGAGSYQTCAIKQDGTLWCWGDNTNGQLGDGTLDTQLAPAQVTGAGAGTVFSHVSTNFLHTCATTSEGFIWCWGLNSNAQTGDLINSYHISPVQVGGAGWVDVSTGMYHTCAVKDDNTLWCWGGNANGQLGTASIPIGQGSQSAVPVQLDGVDWKSVSSGQNHVCAVKLDNSLWCWGDNTYGQLGTGNPNASNVPMNVVVPGVLWSMVATDVHHTCAVDTDGIVWCWGANTNGQLGIGNTDPRLIPTRATP